MRVLIVEDEALIAAEIEMYLEQGGYKVVGHARNGDLALDLVASRNPDIVLLDITIKGTLDGIDVAHIIRKNHKIPFVFLTSHADSVTLSKAKQSMPYGYIVKPFTANDIKSNLEIALFKHSTEQVSSFPSLQQINDPIEQPLKEREYEVFHCLFQGMTYQEAADHICVSLNTVKTYQRTLFTKLGVRSRAEASKKAIDLS